MEWLSHGYGNGRVVDIWAVDAYFGMVCTPILLGEASKIFGWEIILKKNKTHNGYIPLQSSTNINKSCYVDSIWL
jgi:hypothetical protein